MSEGKIRVWATKPGLYGHYRDTGNEFHIEKESDFSKNWMQEVDENGAVIDRGPDGKAKRPGGPDLSKADDLGVRDEEGNPVDNPMGITQGAASRSYDPQKVGGSGDKDRDLSGTGQHPGESQAEGKGGKKQGLASKVVHAIRGDSADDSSSDKDLPQDQPRRKVI